MSTLKVENIQSGYGKKQVVNNVSFELKEGEFCALLGINGCGKSTLIKSILGLIPSMEGSCFVCDKSLWELNEKDRARLVSYIPQRGSNLYGRTVLDVVLMGFNSQMGLFENYSKKQKSLAKKTLNDIGLKLDENTMYEELSEGQKQLVILARTMIQNTPVILMDEPDSALDFTNKNRILKTIKELIHNEQKVGLIAVQDPNIALSYCDRIMIMKEGKVLHDIEKKDFADFLFLQGILSDIYENIKILDNDGVPVVTQNSCGE